MTQPAVLASELALPEIDKQLLFHYTKRCSLFKILQSGNLRLGPYAKTNDPRETKAWVAEVLLAEGGVGVQTLSDVEHVAASADVMLRRGARLACFTVDISPREEANGSLFHRGWGRSNMWAHYAEMHTGACLVFRRDELVGQVDENRGVVDKALFSCGEVTYRDSLLRIPIDMAQVDAHGIESVLDDYQVEKGVPGHLYLTKNRAWESEHEFRIVAVKWNPPEAEWDEALFVPIGTSLEAVIVGDAFEHDQLPILHGYLETREVNVFRCSWASGAPILEII